VRVERWARADTLTPSEQVVTMSGVAVVRALTFSSRRETVYNLAVAGSPTYLVGGDGPARGAVRREAHMRRVGAKQRRARMPSGKRIMILASFLLSGQADADVFTATDAGFVTVAGGSAKGDGTLFSPATFNYSVGFELHFASGALGSPLAPMDRNNYFVFDLSGVVGGTITSATLMVYTGVYESVDPVEEFVLVGPIDPGAALGQAGFLLAANAFGSSAFDDPDDPAIAEAKALYANLAGGPGPFGSILISPADDGAILSIPLGPGGVDYLNALAGGPVLLGGTVVTIDPAAGFPQQPFGFTGPDIPGGDLLTPTLVLTVVPAPAAGCALLAPLGAVATRRRRSARATRIGRRIDPRGVGRGS
jgi:hypothetical protein